MRDLIGKAGCVPPKCRYTRELVAVDGDQDQGGVGDQEGEEGEDGVAEEAEGNLENLKNCNFLLKMYLKNEQQNGKEAEEAEGEEVVLAKQGRVDENAEDD
jgi:hypothetical protein